MVISEIPAQECRALLTASRVGRLACVREDQPYVVPISFVHEDGHIYSFSLIGHKIWAMRKHPQVCLEVDEILNPRSWWSIVAFGRYEELSEAGHRRDELDHAWSLLQKARPNWWVPGGDSTFRDQGGPPASPVLPPKHPADIRAAGDRLSNGHGVIS